MASSSQLIQWYLGLVSTLYMADHDTRFVMHATMHLLIHMNVYMYVYKFIFSWPGVRCGYGFGVVPMKSDSNEKVSSTFDLWFRVCIHTLHSCGQYDGAKSACETPAWKSMLWPHRRRNTQVARAALRTYRNFERIQVCVCCENLKVTVGVEANANCMQSEMDQKEEGNGGSCGALTQNEIERTLREPYDVWPSIAIRVDRVVVMRIRISTEVKTVGSFDAHDALLLFRELDPELKSSVGSVALISLLFGSGYEHQANYCSEAFPGISLWAGHIDIWRKITQNLRKESRHWATWLLSCHLWRRQKYMNSSNWTRATMNRLAIDWTDRLGENVFSSKINTLNAVFVWHLPEKLNRRNSTIFEQARKLSR